MLESPTIINWHVSLVNEIVTSSYFAVECSRLALFYVSLCYVVLRICQFILSSVYQVMLSSRFTVF